MHALRRTDSAETELTRGGTLKIETIVVLILTVVVFANLVWLELKTRRRNAAAAPGSGPPGRPAGAEAQPASPSAKAGDRRS